MSTYEYQIQGEHTSGLTAKHYHGEAISTLNSAAASNIPSNAVVSSVQVKFSGKLSTGDTKVYVGFTNSSDTEPGSKLISSQLTTSQQTWTENLPFSGTSINSGGYSRINVFANSGIVYKKYTCYDFRIIWTYSIPRYTITVKSNNDDYGWTYGSGTQPNGAYISIVAQPYYGYRFVSWSDGDTNPERSFYVFNDATYIAYFEPIPGFDVYVTYDNILDFKRWANNSLSSWVFMNVYNVTDTGFTGQALVDDSYTHECRPILSVTPGITYTFECNTSGGGFEFFIFNCNRTGGWSDYTYGNTNKFNFIPSTNYISIRCDIVGTGTVVNFDNFRIYPADRPYMSNSVLPERRTNLNAWDMPTPTREGYKFLGWNDKPDGTGTTYTSSSAFPTSDLVLYSQWEKLPPEFKSVEMIYLNKQISSSNKVICNEGFIISVGVT